ncbi:MAG: hypothetical protein ACC645_26370, partial [Pirellulales bacterium]
NNWTVIDPAILQGRNISGVVARGSMLMASANFFEPGGGLYRSTDTGTSWTLVSGSSGLTSGAISDMVSDPTNPNRFYVTVIGVGVFTSADSGATWANVSSGDATLNTAMTSAGNNNAEMAMAPNGRVFIGVMDNGQPSYIGYTDNQGGGWTAMDFPQTPESDGDTEGLSPRSKPGAQGAIHFSIVADPNDSNVVYVAGDRQDFPFPNFLGANDFSGRIFRGNTTIAPTGAVPSPQWDHMTHSNAVGQTPNGGTASSSAPHADSREMVFNAAGDLVEVDDGGIYIRTDPRTNQGDWFSLIGDLQVTEIHDIAYDSNSNILIAAAQDTGTPQQTAPGSLVWDSVTTADGGGVEVDDTSTPGLSNRYASFQNMGAFRKFTYDSSNTLQSVTFPGLQVVGGGSFFFPRFYTPFKVNAVDGNRLVFGGALAVYESFDQAETLNDIGPGLIVNDSLTSEAIAYGGWRNGIANPEVLYLGVGSSVYVRQSGNGTPVVQPSYPGGSVRDIVLNADDWSEAFVVDDDQVFRTQNGGQNWSEITFDLPSSLTLWSLEYVPASTGTGLVVGTNGGVFSFNPQANSWSTLGTDLPNAVVADLEYDRTDDVLVVGTLGRGAFLIPDVSEVLSPLSIKIARAS